MLGQICASSKRIRTSNHTKSSDVAAIIDQLLILLYLAKRREISTYPQYETLSRRPDTTLVHPPPPPIS